MAALPPSPASGSASSLFEGHLPQEIVEHVVHFLSHRPHFVHPQSFVAARDVLAAFDVSAQLRAAALKRFRSIATIIDGKRWDATSYELDAAPPGLLVEDHLLLPSLLVALGDTLQQLSVANVRNIGLSWVEALTREVRPIRALELHGIDESFPLEDVLVACGALRKLHLVFNVYATSWHLDSVAERCSQVADLALHNVNPLGGFSRIWTRLKGVQELTLTTGRVAQVTGPVGNVYDGIAHPQSQLRKLNFGKLRVNNLYAALHLCRAIGHRLQDLTFELQGPLSDVVLILLGEMKESCPNVAVSLTCRADHLLYAMQVLRDSLLEVRPTKSMFTRTPNELAESAAMCTKLRSIELCLCDTWAEGFLEQLLPHVGGSLRELILYVYPTYIPETLADPNPLYLAPVAQYTGKLQRLEVENAQPNTSFDSVAMANPELRGLVVIVDSRMRAVVGDEDNILDKWLVTMVRDFLTNCQQLEDIVIEEGGREDAGELLLRNSRISGLDDVCLSLSQGRKVGIRVGNTFYDR